MSSFHSWSKSTTLPKNHLDKIIVSGCNTLMSLSILENWASRAWQLFKKDDLHFCTLLKSQKLQQNTTGENNLKQDALHKSLCLMKQIK